MNHRRLSGFLLIIALIFTLAACGEPAPPSPEEAADEIAEAATQAENTVLLTDSAWALEMIGGPGDELPLIEGVTPTLNFFVERYTGFSGCNYYLAAFDIDVDSISMYGPTQTVLQCDKPDGVMEQEATFIGILQNSTAYRVDEDKLTLFTVGDQALATLARIEDIPLEGTTWLLKTYIVDDEPVPLTDGALVSAQFDGDQLSGSAGCNDYSATVAIGDGSMTISEVTTTTNNVCDEPEGIMAQEETYSAMLESVAAYEQGGSSLLLADAEGTPIMLFAAGE